jgi:Protein of unknown function (DUF1488)
MPLRNSNNRPDHHDDRQAIGFWMTVEGKDPVQPIRVFVTYEGLRELDPSQPPNPTVALDIFTRSRERIEAAASKKFDAKGVDEGEYKGKPVLVVRSMGIGG